ncbi:MAG: hypothetical protein ACLUSP_08915 [Christensenellales bacterium]
MKENPNFSAEPIAFDKVKAGADGFVRFIRNRTERTDFRRIAKENRMILADLTYEEVEKLAADLGVPSYRAKQLYAHITRFDEYDEMSDLPAAFRENSDRFTPRAGRNRKKLVSRDGTEKYLYRLTDGNIIEGAFMMQSYGNTLCVSTQVGCRMGCAFCASGIGGLVRNLTAGEILSQVLCVNREAGGNAKREP